MAPSCWHSAAPGLEVERLQRLEPSVFVRREHAEGLTQLGQHLAAFENHVVLEAVEHDAAVGQVAQDVGVSGVG
jgi:hypothetical protein